MIKKSKMLFRKSFEYVYENQKKTVKPISNPKITIDINQDINERYFGKIWGIRN